MVPTMKKIKVRRWECHSTQEQIYKKRKSVPKRRKLDNEGCYYQWKWMQKMDKVWNELKHRYEDKMRWHRMRRKVCRKTDLSPQNKLQKKWNKKTKKIEI